jgi:hypothetical protein
MFAKTFAVLMVAFFGTLGIFLLLQRQFRESAAAFGCAILAIYYLVGNRSGRKSVKRYLR